MQFSNCGLAIQRLQLCCSAAANGSCSSAPSRQQQFDSCRCIFAVQTLQFSSRSRAVQGQLQAQFGRHNVAVHASLPGCKRLGASPHCLAAGVLVRVSSSTASVQQLPLYNCGLDGTYVAPLLPWRLQLNGGSSAVAAMGLRRTRQSLEHSDDHLKLHRFY